LACIDAERGYINTNKLSVAIAKYFNDIICLISNDIITTDGTKNKILENILRNFKPTGCKEKTEGGKKRKTKKNRRKTRK